MRVTLDLDDDLADFYQEEAQARSTSLHEVLADRLKHAGQLDPRNRYIILTDSTRERVENRIGICRDAEDLVGKVERLAKIKFGEHEILLTSGQLEELKWRAHKQGKSIEEMIRQIWLGLQEHFFSAVP